MDEVGGICVSQCNRTTLGRDFSAGHVPFLFPAPCRRVSNVSPLIRGKQFINVSTTYGVCGPEMDWAVWGSLQIESGFGASAGGVGGKAITFAHIRTKRFALVHVLC